MSRWWSEGAEEEETLVSIGRPRERAEKVSTHRCAGLWSECAEQEERAVRKGRGRVRKFGGGGSSACGSGDI